MSAAIESLAAGSKSFSEYLKGSSKSARNAESVPARGPLARVPVVGVSASVELRGLDRAALLGERRGKLMRQMIQVRRSAMGALVHRVLSALEGMGDVGAGVLIGVPNVAFNLLRDLL